MTETLIEDQTYTKVPRAELVTQLRTRDGDRCMHPDCGRPLDFDLVVGPDERTNPLEITIDHWYPQYAGRADGWTMAQIWALDNLKLMHKKCNAKKGDLIPNEDGSLPEKPKSTFRFRRQKRAGRPEMCLECNNGHDLLIGEYCASCGCNTQRFPREAKVKFSDCDHELLWCWLCSITPDMRPSSIGIAMRQADSTELGEYRLDEE